MDSTTQEQDRDDPNIMKSLARAREAALVRDALAAEERQTARLRAYVEVLENRERNLELIAKVAELHIVGHRVLAFVLGAGPNDDRLLILSEYAGGEVGKPSYQVWWENDSGCGDELPSREFSKSELGALGAWDGAWAFFLAQAEEARQDYGR